MPKSSEALIYPVLSPIDYSDEIFLIGDAILLEESEAAELVKLGVLGKPSKPKKEKES